MDKERAKEQSRVSRLQWSHQAEHKLRQELNDIAIAKCKEITQKFAECAKENGLLVVFKCRQHNKDMNECLHQYTNDQEFEKYRQQRSKDFLQQIQEEE